MAVSIETAIAYSILAIGIGLAISSPLWMILLFGWLIEREQEEVSN